MKSVVALIVALALIGMSHVLAAGTVPSLLLSVPAARSTVALTFDDGPSPYTPQILAILHARGAHATFFVVGKNVAALPALVRAEVAAGDEVGNHTYTHADLTWLPTATAAAQIGATQTAVRSATGVSPGWFRPPYGAVDGRVINIAAGLGLRTVLWSVDPRDWARPGVDAIVRAVLLSVRPGSIVIMHDGGGDRSETVAALPFILTGLRARGLTPVTLSDLAFGSRTGSPRSTPRKPVVAPTPGNGPPPHGPHTSKIISD